MFIQNITTKPEKKTDDGNSIRIVLPFKDQIAANAVRRQLRDLSSKISVTLQPIFVSKKLEQDLKPKEIKPSIVSRQCVVFKFACDLCDADYVGYTARHLHQRIAEHKYSAIGKHLLDAHVDKNLINEGQFRVLKKQGCCLTGARSPGAPKFRVRAAKVLFKEPEHGVFIPI